MKIALIAHDRKKTELVTFVMQNKQLFDGVEVYATATTGSFLETAGLTVHKVLSGPKGGDAQIAALVATGDIQVVFFFRDPLDKHPHEPDVQMLMRICDVHNVPLATNPAAAILMLAALKLDDSKAILSLGEDLLKD